MNSFCKKILILALTTASFSVANAFDSPVDENGKYTKKYISENIIRPTMYDAEAINEGTKDKSIEIKNLRLADQGSSYIINYLVYGEMRDQYKSDDEALKNKIKYDFLKYFCNTQDFADQLPFLDSIQFNFFDKDKYYGAEPIMTFSATKETCEAK